MKLSTLVIGFAWTTGSIFNPSSHAQNATGGINIADSLSFQEVLNKVLTGYPSMMKAQEAIRSADAGIGLAKSAYYPDIHADLGYTRLDPVPEITFGETKFPILPENNYNAVLGIWQTIYDFEKTARDVKLKKSDKEISEKNVELVRQRLTLITAISYFSLAYLQDALKIKDLQIETLKKHLDFVKKKEETGSSTQYEILSTQVRISTAENQKVDMETSRQTQLAILNALLGIPESTQLSVKNNLALIRPDVREDSLVTFALDHRYEMAMVKLRKEHSELHLRSVKVMNNPVLSAFANGGVKNGYFPDLNQPIANIAAGVGLVVPIFDATRRKYTIHLVNSEINMAKQDIDQVTREVSSEVYQNQQSLLASLKKIDLSTLQVRQAEEALSLAAVSFKAGVITNLDLLDAESNAEQSRINLLKARVDYAINVVRLDISLGLPIR